MRCFSISIIIVPLIFFSSSLCELSLDKQDSFLNAFIDYLNSRPDQEFVYEDGVFLKSSQKDENTYKIDIRVKIFKLQYASTYRFQKCTATILDLGENGITIPNNEYQCTEWTNEEPTPVPVGATTDAVQVLEDPQIKEPIHLDNEVQAANAPTSGEQFIAIPRDRSGPCIGCSSHVDPSAAGVDELAVLGARHLDKHEPNVKHTVIAVHDVERQVQVTNGIRYILLLTIGYNNCTELLTDNCVSEKTCKISILSKPWVKFPDGSKYKAILANNCTEQWLFGDNGEPIPEILNKNKPTDNNDQIGNSGPEDEKIRVVHTADVLAQQHTQLPFSNDDIRNIEEQIIPYSEFNKSLNNSHSERVITDSVLKEKRIDSVESAKIPDRDSIQVRNPEKLKNTRYITEEKKKAIDDMLNLFNFAEFQPLHEDTEDLSRGKRSYTSDMQVMSVLEKFQKIKRKLKNAKHIYKLGKLLVNYLNEMDMEVKTRVLKDVILAEEEIEKDQHFFYIRVRVIIPCDKVECDNKDTQIKICNGVIDSTDSKSPEVVDIFCYDEEKKPTLGKLKNVPKDDTILLKLTNETVKKIEDDMHIRNALRVVKIINAYTQKVSGTLTKISMVLEYTDCNKTVPFYNRENCLTIQTLGSKICEAEIHELHSLKDKKISYICTNRPIDETIDYNIYTRKSKDTKDLQVMKIINEALQLLEVQSNRNNKQKVVEIKSISTQIVAGQLTNIDFVVGYTKCFANNIDIYVNKCELIESERLRQCQVQVWERPWLQEGRQIKVVCDDDTNKTEKYEVENRRRKRQIPGGENEVDAKNPKYIQLAQESLSKYLQDSGETKPHKILKVNKVTVQVVAGTPTKIDFDVQGSGETFSCQSDVWERPWLTSKEIKVTCSKDQNSQQKKFKRETLVGGAQEKDPKNEKYVKLAQESLSKYLQDSGETKPHKILKVNKVTVQVVAGTLTKIDFDVQGSGETFSCQSDVWERPWLTSKEIKVTCSKDQNSHQKKFKRETLVGGAQEKDPKNEKYVKLAQESLSKYLQDSGETKPHKILKVNKVTVQVVAGILTKIDFDVQGSGQTFSCQSDVWERPWLTSKEIKVTCSKDQNSQQKKFKRETLVGGAKEKDPKNEKYVKLAQESLSKYLQDSGETKPHKILKVNKVTVQVVAGTLTKIDFDVQGSGQTFSCQSDVWERPWLTSKEIKVTCSKDQNSQQKKFKRETLVGGAQEKDPKNEKYVKLAQESLSKYLQDSGETKPHKILKVNKVTVQVVAGTLTKIDFDVQGSGETFSCQSDVWERPWLTSKEIKVTCSKDHNSQQKKFKRETLVGGAQEKDPKNEKYVKLAQESLSKYLQDSGETKPHKILKVNKVTVQVVAGTLTKIDFDVQGSGQTFSCQSDVWERPWLTSKEIKVTCSKNQNSQQKKFKRETLKGGAKEKDPKNEKYVKLAQESLSKYLQDSGETKPHKILKVNKVTVQVVAGTQTKIDFDVQGSGETFSCQSDVWERPWLTSKEITVTCSKNQNSQQKKFKRETLVGGAQEKDPKNEKYVKLAQESLSKYLQDSGDTKPHTVLKVNKVTVQVVAGTLTKIDFDVQGSGETFSCQSDVWERPWLTSKEIKVTCSKDQNSQQKRFKRETLVGGAIKEDPTNEKFIKLAEESINKYVENVGSIKIHKLIELNRVIKQLVTGTITRLDFVMSPTNCDVNNKSHKVCSVLENADIRCHSDIWERPWLKVDNKIIDVTCDDLKKNDENTDNLQGEHIAKEIKKETKPKQKGRSVTAKKVSRKSGGAVNQDPTKPFYRVLADEALRKYQLRKKSLDHHEITHVKRVVSQVVSGMKYNIEFEVLRVSCALNEINKTECDQKNNVTLTCYSTIWSRPWLKSKEINVDCSSDKEANEDSEEDSSSEKIKRKKRNIGLGSAQNKDPNDKQYMNLALEAVKKYQKNVEADHIFKINKIFRVTEQVVSGFVTNIDFSISPTTCLLSDPPDKVDDCQLLEPNVILHCSAEINEPAIPRTMEIKIGCKKRNKKSNRQKRVTLNREKRESPYDDDYVEEDIKYYYADRAISDFNSRASTNNLYKVVSIHDVHRSVHMDTLMVRLYLEIAMTYCMRYGEEHDLQNCDEIDGMSHKLCLARVYPSPDDELVVQHATMTCDDDKNFETISGVSIDEFIRVSIAEIEKSPDIHYKLVPLGEPNVIPSLNYKMPIRMNFVVHHTNCTKDINLGKTPTKCVINNQRSGRNCHSLIYLMPNSRNIQNVVVKCAIGKQIRAKRSVSLDPKNATADDLLVQQMVQESIEKLEMASEHKYKQRVLVINSYSSKIVTGRLTTIDFDVGYTTCLKYEWVENATSCEFLEHLPRRHCISHVWERLWVENGRQIEVICEDDETPLEAHIEFESAENAMQLANEALKHIEAKYPNPRRQKIVRIFSLEQQAIAGFHYRMKVEVGVTDCMALSINKDDCRLVNDINSQNKFCRVNVWMRPWTDHPPSFRVTCDYQSGAMDEIYHHVQAERLFYDFLATYKPNYLNDAIEMKNRFAIFKENVRKIHELNIYERGTARYAITSFADLSYEEFSSKYLGLKPGMRDHNHVPMRMADIPEVELPSKYDWRDYGAVTEVKDQGSCGSCWAFSVTGNIEGQWKLQSGKLVSLSEQELVDCDDLDEGCNGGLPDNAYRAIEKLGGLETENDYPYEGTDDKCAYNKSLSRVHISGAVNITSNETDMAKWLTRNGPISIGINANAMQFYVGGISHPWKMLCSPNNLDHGVLIVGYGAKDYPLFHKHLPYWIIKNSWGQRWGEQGYYRVYRGDGTCGVNQMASSAVI